MFPHVISFLVHYHFTNINNQEKLNKGNKLNQVIKQPNSLLFGFIFFFTDSHDPKIASREYVPFISFICNLGLCSTSGISTQFS